MIFGQLLIYALIAAFLAWLTEWLLSRWGAQPWAVRISYGFVLIYAFAVLMTSGPIRVGQ